MSFISTVALFFASLLFPAATVAAYYQFLLFNGARSLRDVSPFERNDSYELCMHFRRQYVVMIIVTNPVLITDDFITTTSAKIHKNANPSRVLRCILFAREQIGTDESGRKRVGTFASKRVVCILFYRV